MISVVIPVLDGLPDLLEQVDALAGQEVGEDWELVLADNGSTDGTREAVQARTADLPAVTIVDASRVRAQAHALNVGIAAARGDKLVLLDADDRVEPGYLAALGRALDEHALCCSRLATDALNPPWLRESRPAAQQSEAGTPFGFLPVAAGCSLALRRDLFEELGPFDETIPVAQDVDYCWRAGLAGHHIQFVADAVLQYRYRPELRAIYRQGRGYGAAQPLLYTRYAASGMPRRSWRSVVRYHLGPLRRLPAVRSRAGRAEMAFLVGLRVGVLRGAIRHRVRYL